MNLFAQPSMLGWLIILPMLATALHCLFLRKQVKAHLFIQAHLWDAKQQQDFLWRERFKAVSLIMSVFFGVLALARPQWGDKEQVLKQQGMDILVAVDVSKSMLTRDVRPSRLERTQWALRDLVKKLNGDRVGLMAFAGSSFVMCPLTLDYNGFLLSVDDLSPTVIPRGGTSISSAIEEALRNYGKTNTQYQALVIVTDGDDLEGQALEAAKRAKDKGIKIFTVGVGTKEGDLIEIMDDHGGHDFLKDASGNVVKSRLNENLLQQIAFETNGAYVRSSPTEFGLDFLYDKQLSLIPKREGENKISRQREERYQWPVALALVAFLIQFILPSPIKVIKVVTVVVMVMLASSAEASINNDVNKANSQLRTGNFDNAVSLYQQAFTKKPESSAIAYNLANGYYKQGQFEKALPLFEQAAKDKDIALQTKALFNAGNAQFRLGKAIEKQAIDKAIDHFKQAIDQYQHVLSKDNKDEQAVHNKRIAEEALKKLEQEKKQQQQNQQQKQDDKNNNQQKQQNNNQEQQQDKQNQQQHQGQDKQQDNKEQENKDQQSTEKQEQQQDKQDKQHDKQQQAQADKKDSPQQEQAKALLEDYQRSEEPKGMLYLTDKKYQEEPVIKDW